MQMLKDVSKLINLTLNQARNHQLLSKSTTFNRIEIPLSSDPLNGDGFKNKLTKSPFYLDS